MSDNNKYYAVKFKIQQKSFFSIWFSGEKGDVFLKRDNQLVFFLNSKDLYNFCEENSTTIESETSFDFDFIDYTDCNKVIDLWNITSDMANTLDLPFIGDADEMTGIYQKLFYGCNLPALNYSDEKYIPHFSNTEITKINKVILNMKEIVKTAFC